MPQRHVPLTLSSAPLPFLCCCFNASLARNDPAGLQFGCLHRLMCFPRHTGALRMDGLHHCLGCRQMPVMAVSQPWRAALAGLVDAISNCMLQAASLCCRQRVALGAGQQARLEHCLVEKLNIILELSIEPGPPCWCSPTSRPSPQASKHSPGCVHQKCDRGGIRFAA